MQSDHSNLYKILWSLIQLWNLRIWKHDAAQEMEIFSTGLFGWLAEANNHPKIEAVEHGL